MFFVNFLFNIDYLIAVSVPFNILTKDILDLISKDIKKEKK